MDDEGDNARHDHSVTTNDVEDASGEIECGDNSTSDHTVVVDPDQLIGPQVIDMIMNKPEFSFLIRYYSLLYQSLIPNCKLTLHTLRQHISISDNIEQYIVGAASHRTSCQRLINLLITRLYSDKDYMQFCYYLNLISVMNDLPNRLIAEFCRNGNWKCSVPAHPRLSLQSCRCHVSQHGLHYTNTMDMNIEAESLSALSSVDRLDYSSVNDSTLQCCVVHDGASDDRADKCSISGYYHHRKQHLTVHTTTTDEQFGTSQDTTTEEYEVPQILCTNNDFTELKAHYHNILRLMPDDYELTVGKLLNCVSDDQICTILSSSNSTIANKIILDCLIERLRCREDLLDLCDQLENITTSHDMKIVINEIRLGVQQSIQFPISTTVTTNTPSLSTDQQHLSVSPRSLLMPLSPTMSSAVVVTQITSATSSSNASTLSNTATVTSTSIPSVHPLPLGSKQDCQARLQYEEKRQKREFKYLRPPPLPSSHVNRQILLDEITTKLLQASVDPDRYETTLTITGAGGFGKTTTAISLCHHHLIKKQFTDGFVFIELGPQATDPCIKLRAIYDLLTNEQCDINIVEQKIDQLISDYFRNLLVIIDDVWHVEDAEPLVKAFTNCKTILTTRMNNIEQYIPSKQSVIIGPMMEDEAISLLTSGVIDKSQLSQEDVKLLDDLAQDVHLWPLLLSLIRGQLSHNLKQFHFSYHEAIQNVQAKLHHKGLVAFDKDNIEDINKSRKLAVKACIEMTLELLTKSLSNKIKSLILFTGIGTSLQTELLDGLWSISKQAAEDTVDVLWAYGLVQLTDITIIFPYNIKQHCVEVHSVISQYIIESMDSVDACNLSPMIKKSTFSQFFKAIKDLFLKTYGVHDPSTLTPVDYLKYELSVIEGFKIPFTFKIINMRSVIEPHFVILLLKEINNVLMSSPDTINLLSLLGEEIISLKAECEHTIKDAHKLCRKLNQSVQRNLHYKGYDKLIQTVEEFIKNYPLCNIAQKSITMVNKIIPYCEGELLHYMMKSCQSLQTMTHDYHEITLSELPRIKYILKHHKLITGSSLHGSPDIDATYHYFISGKAHEELDLVTTNRLIKLQEIDCT